MRFKDIAIDSPSPSVILKRLFELYPTEKDSRAGYEEVIWKLKLLSVAGASRKSKLEIVLHRYTEDGEDWTNVSGIEDGESVCISFIPWSELMAMKINRNTLKEFTKLDILCHCLWEITYYGFREEEIQGTFNELINTVEDIQKDLHT